MSDTDRRTRGGRASRLLARAWVATGMTAASVSAAWLLGCGCAGAQPADQGTAEAAVAARATATDSVASPRDRTERAAESAWCPVKSAATPLDGRLIRTTGDAASSPRARASTVDSAVPVPTAAHTATSHGDPSKNPAGQSVCRPATAEPIHLRGFRPLPPATLDDSANFPAQPGTTPD